MTIFGNHHGERGISLLETMVTIAVISVVMVFGTRNILSIQALQNLVQDRAVVTDLEENVRRVVFDDASLNTTAGLNPRLEACLVENDTPCPQGVFPFDLYLTDERKVTGTYHADGRQCQGSDCVLSVTTTFQGICGAQAVCDTVRYLLVNYVIELNNYGLGTKGGVLLKRGQLRRTFRVPTTEDENQACDTDDLGRPQFANSLNRFGINCIDLPRLNRQVQGVNVGSCRAGVELLVGFDGNGDPICEAINFGNRAGT